MLCVNFRFLALASYRERSKSSSVYGLNGIDMGSRAVFNSDRGSACAISNGTGGHFIDTCSIGSLPINISILVVHFDLQCLGAAGVIGQSDGVGVAVYNGFAILGVHSDGLNAHIVRAVVHIKLHCVFLAALCAVFVPHQEFGFLNSLLLVGHVKSPHALSVRCCRCRSTMGSSFMGNNSGSVVISQRHVYGDSV